MRTANKKLQTIALFMLSAMLIFSAYVMRPTAALATNKSFQIRKQVSSLTAGETFQLQTNASSNVKYGSTTAKVASVSQTGLITAKRCGTTTIRVRHGKELITFQLKVKPKKVIEIKKIEEKMKTKASRMNSLNVLPPYTMIVSG